MAKPLYDSLLALAKEHPLRLHMPGHKGELTGLFRDIAQIDFTEIPPTGNLYTGEGAIAEAEDLCAAYAGAGEALFFTCGSTQGIYTMLAAAVGARGHLILERGCHKSVYHAMALLDITPHDMYAPLIPGTGLTGPVDAALLAQTLDACPEAAAVFLTSPTYYGVITDLAPLAELCHRRGVSLLVDQAHGAHFPSVGLPAAPAQGADLAVVSTHKTWPAMGSSSILYVGKGSPFEKSALKHLATLFGTTSPSYPILASIDYARDALEGELGARYRETAARTAAFRTYLNEHEIFHALEPTPDLSLDPCRLTIDTLSRGIPGYQADLLLQKQNIYVEMSDERYIVLILTCCDGAETFSRLLAALTAMVQEHGLTSEAAEESPPPRAIPRMSIRAALFGPRETLPLIAAAGRISAEIVAPYPPGIPILVPGEEITQKHIAYLQKKSYNITEPIAVSTADSEKEA